jgi:hypothetical protein
MENQTQVSGAVIVFAMLLGAVLLIIVALLVDNGGLG